MADQADDVVAVESGRTECDPTECDPAERGPAERGPAGCGPADGPAVQPRAARAVVVRVLCAAVAAPVLAGYAATVALVTLVSTTAGAQWSVGSTLRSAAPLWLAVHQVPLTIAVPGRETATLGVLPLLPTLGLGLLVAWSAAGAVARLDWHTPAQLAGLTAAFAGGNAALGVLIAIAGPVQRIGAAPVAAAFGCAAVSGLAAALGGLRAAGVDRVLSPVLPAWAVRGLHLGLAALVGLLAVGALCTFGGLVLSAGTVHELISSWGDTDGGRFGVTLLSVAYLPNAVVAGTAWAAGPGLAIGAVSVTPFGTTGGALPAMPLLAALPEPQPAPWRLLVFALPALVGLLIGWRCRSPVGRPLRGTTALDRADRLHAVVTASAAAAAGGSVLAILAGGRLGDGAFDPVRIPSASLAIAVFCWLVLPAALVAGLGDRVSRPAVPDAELAIDDELALDGELAPSAVDDGFGCDDVEAGSRRPSTPVSAAANEIVGATRSC